MSKLPDYPMPGKSVEQTVRDIIDYLRMTTITNFYGGQMKQSRGGTTLSVRRESRPKIQDLPYTPFYPILEGNKDEGFILTMRPGNVILRKKKGADANLHILPTDIPDKLEVQENDKITLKIEEDVEGEFTTASVVKTSGDWPTSTAPDLDETTTSGAVRHVRLCEIVEETDIVTVKIWSTGHVDHFAPTILQSSSGYDADVLKGYESGKWILRGLVAGSGIAITENADSIEIETSDGGDGWWGTLEWAHFANITDTTPYDLLQVEVENGRIMSVAYQGPGDANPIAVDGDQTTPGFAQFASYAEP